MEEEVKYADADKQINAELNEPMQSSSEKAQEVTEKDIQKVFIRNYGNLTIEIVGTNEIGLKGYSERRKENLFIPWSSIIMCSKIEGMEDESGD